MIRSRKQSCLGLKQINFTNKKHSLLLTQVYKSQILLNHLISNYLTLCSTHSHPAFNLSMTNLSNSHCHLILKNNKGTKS